MTTGNREWRPLRGARLLLETLGIAFGFVCLVEAGARLATGGPHGTFEAWFPGRLGLYPENATLRMPGPVGWEVRTNEWGFRGGPLALEKTPGRTRIAMIGDSVTDGFCVENENTYPAMTRAALESRGFDVEVINGAAGGGTIDRELAILRDAMSRFEPDVVVLTFVTNDFQALESVSDTELIDPPPLRHGDRAARRTLRAFATGSALGEQVFDLYLRARFKEYRASPRPGPIPVDLGPDRYTRAGGADFAANSRLFMRRFRSLEGRILTTELDAAMQVQLRRYLGAWDAFMKHARARGMRPVFAYFPAYPEVYDAANSPMTVRDRLRRHSESAGVPFLDLTPALRSRAGAVLHLAPVDFHLNPAGNRVIGTALADFLLERGLVGGSSR